MSEPFWKSITEEELTEIIKICDLFDQQLYSGYNTFYEGAEWFYEDEGLSKIYLVMAVDTPEGKYYYKNINVIK